MTVREPVRAGTFYESAQQACRRHAQQLHEEAVVPEDLPATLYGGLVPHAGWPFSGRLAALTFAALCKVRAPDTFVLFGADHTGQVRSGDVYAQGAWRTPLGEMAIDEQLAALILQSSPHLQANPQAHAREHSLEVQIPLIQTIAPQARILPIAVPPSDLAIQVGQAVGKVLEALSDKHVQVVGSTDLTHVGGHFGSPVAPGEPTEQYARQNDRRILDRIEAMDAPGVLAEAAQHHSACGAGAIAATIAATKAMGASAGHLIEYTNSYQVLRRVEGFARDDTTVGYASVVFG